MMIRKKGFSSPSNALLLVMTKKTITPEIEVLYIVILIQLPTVQGFIPVEIIEIPMKTPTIMVMAVVVYHLPVVLHEYLKQIHILLSHLVAVMKIIPKKAIPQHHFVDPEATRRRHGLVDLSEIALRLPVTIRVIV